MKQVIGVVVPLSTEAGFLLGFRGWRRFHGKSVKEVFLDSGLKLLCVRGGMGPTHAEASAQWLAEQGAKALAVLGVCGGLTPSLSTGDLMIPQAVVADHGLDRRKRWDLDASLSDPLYRFLISKKMTVHRGVLLSRPHPVLTESEKTVLGTTCGARAVDMESGSVARVAHDREIPLIVIRSVCDTVSTDIPEILPEMVSPEGTLRWPAILTRLLFYPLLMATLMGWGFRFIRALSTLKRAWRLMVEKEAESPFIDLDSRYH